MHAARVRGVVRSLAAADFPRFDHICVPVPKLELIAPFIEHTLQAKPYEGGVTHAFRGCSWKCANGGKIESLEPTSSDVKRNFLARFLARHGSMAHHVTFLVDDIRHARDSLVASGMEVLDYNDEDPSWKELFLHPKQSLGIVVQLAQFDPARRAVPTRFAHNPVFGAADPRARRETERCNHASKDEEEWGPWFKFPSADPSNATITSHAEPASSHPPSASSSPAPGSSAPPSASRSGSPAAGAGAGAVHLAGLRLVCASEARARGLWEHLLLGTCRELALEASSASSPAPSKTLFFSWPHSPLYVAVDIVPPSASASAAASPAAELPAGLKEGPQFVEVCVAGDAPLDLQRHKQHVRQPFRQVSARIPALAHGQEPPRPNSKL